MNFITEIIPAADRKTHMSIYTVFGIHELREIIFIDIPDISVIRVDRILANLIANTEEFMTRKKVTSMYRFGKIKMAVCCCFKPRGICTAISAGNFEIAEYILDNYTLRPRMVTYAICCAYRKNNIRIVETLSGFDRRMHGKMPLGCIKYLYHRDCKTPLNTVPWRNFKKLRETLRFTRLTPIYNDDFTNIVLFGSVRIVKLIVNSGVDIFCLGFEDIIIPRDNLPMLKYLIKFFCTRNG